MQKQAHIKEKMRKSIIEMLVNIDDEKAIERIHRFVEYIYIHK